MHHPASPVEEVIDQFVHNVQQAHYAEKEEELANMSTLWDRYLAMPHDDGLTDVQRTALFVAALRAYDQRLSDKPLAMDPLAELLAGPIMMEKIHELLVVKNENAHDDFNHNSIAARGFILDHLVTQAVKTLRAAHLQGAARIQVVNIGAGMDTRPWRLSDLGQDVSWFEVDMHEMVTLKRQLLAKAGAQLPEQPSGKPSAPTTAVEAQDTTAPKDNTLGVGLEWMGSPFPITCGRLVAIPCKLEGSENGAGLIPALMNAGYDKTCPTVWIAEGLVMYLEPSTLFGLMTDMENLSTPGSKAIITTLTQDTLNMMQASVSAARAKHQRDSDLAMHNSAKDLIGDGGSSQGLLQSHSWSLVYNLNDLRDLLPDLAPGHHSRNFAFLSMKSVVEGLVVAERKEGIRH